MILLDVVNQPVKLYVHRIIAEDRDINQETAFCIDRDATNNRIDNLRGITINGLNFAAIGLGFHVSNVDGTQTKTYRAFGIAQIHFPNNSLYYWFPNNLQDAHIPVAAWKNIEQVIFIHRDVSVDDETDEDDKI